MPLPLTARKSLRDQEEYLTKAQDEIKATLGEEWLIEFDWDTLFDKLEANTQKQIGEIFYKEVCTQIAKTIVTAAKDEITKEALVEANPSRKVVVLINEDKKNTTYWKYEFANGQLNLLFRANICNINDIGYFSLYKIIPSAGVYTLGTRLNLQKNQEKLQESFEKLKQITGRDWSFDEAAMELVYPAFDTVSAKESFGDTFLSILQAAVSNIEKRCKTSEHSEITMEAFLAATENARIVFRLANPKQQSAYWVWSFENGDLVISFKSICNISDNNYHEFTKVLPSPGVFSIITRLDMKKYEEKFETALERIKQVTKHDWTYDQAALELLYPTLDESNKNRLGETFAEILTYIASNIEKRCTEDITREAFIENTSNSTIKFVLAPKQSAYWVWAFVNGELVISFKSICNTSDNQHLDFNKVLPSAGVYSILTLLDMKKYQEKFETAFEKIKVVTGSDWTYDQAALETIYPTFDESNKNRLGETFAEILTYIANNIEKRCAEDMTKEAFIENTSNSTIKFVLAPKQSTYWIWAFVNGDLVISFKSICNTSDNQHLDFVKVLPSPGVFSLIAKLDMKKYQESFDESLEKIKACLGTEWVVEQSSLEEVYPHLEDSNKSRIGETFAEIVKYISQNIVKRCGGDEMVKEAFIENTPNGKIIFRCDKKQSMYWNWTFDQGNLIVSFKSICNTSDCAHFNFEKLL